MSCDINPPVLLQIAAGMKAELELQLYAIAVGVTGGTGQGSIGHHIEIITENEMLYLPVSANIMTAYQYDEHSRTLGKPPLSAGVRLISTRPPSREGIIRPRKDNTKGKHLLVFVVCYIGYIWEVECYVKHHCH